MDSFQVLIILMFAAIILVGVSQKIHIPYPIILVLGGVAIGFNPTQYTINFDPNILLAIVLPPILYYAAFGISFREFRQNWKEISSLALGLVVFTTFVIGVTFKWLFPDFSWALAFTFGAIVSPPDAIAATSILKRFSISHRLLTILEGESLINDASALVLYRIAVATMLSGVFSISQAGMEFIKIVIGGIAFGLISGYITQNFSRRYLEPAVGVAFSFTIPYLTYIGADALGISGVLAVVVNGLFGSQILLRHHSSLRRVLGYAAWDIFIILMNCFVFILIGLQLKILISIMTIDQMILYSIDGLMVSLALIVIRLAWVYTRNAIVSLRSNQKKSKSRHSQTLRESALVGWSGMRGIVSLVAALAIPYSLPSGMPLEGRGEVIFITFVVILFTLLIPGLSLPFLIKKLKIQPTPAAHHAWNVHNVRKQLMNIALESIHEFHQENRINDRGCDFLKAYFNLKSQLLEVSSSDRKDLQNIETVRNLVIQEQRKKLIEIWEKLEIDDTLLNQLEHELDLEEIQTARGEIK